MKKMNRANIRKLVAALLLVSSLGLASCGVLREPTPEGPGGDPGVTDPVDPGGDPVDPGEDPVEGVPAP